MKCSLDISNFPEEISSLSHSIVFFYFFALITEENFHIFPLYSLELCIQMVISFLFSFAFCSSSFLSYCKASLDSYFAFFAFIFLRDGFDHSLLYNITNVTNLDIPSGTLSIRSKPLNLFFTSTVTKD